MSKEKLSLSQHIFKFILSISVLSMVLCFPSSSTRAYMYSHDDFFLQLHVALGQSIFTDRNYPLMNTLGDQKKHIDTLTSYLLELNTGFTFLENIFNHLNYIIYLGLSQRGGLAFQSSKINYSYASWNLGLLQYITSENIFISLQRNHILAGPWKTISMNRASNASTSGGISGGGLIATGATRLKGGQGWGLAIGKEKWIGPELSLGVVLSVQNNRLQIHNPYSDITVIDTFFSHEWYGIGVSLSYN